MSTEVAAPLVAFVIEEKSTVVVDATTAEDEVSNNEMCNGSTGWPLSNVGFGISRMIPRLEGLDSQLLTALVLYYNQATTEKVVPVSEETLPAAGEPSMENAEISMEEEAPEAAVGEETAEVPDFKKRTAEDADVADSEEMVSSRHWPNCTGAWF